MDLFQLAVQLIMSLYIAVIEVRLPILFNVTRTCLNLRVSFTILFNFSPEPNIENFVETIKIWKNISNVAVVSHLFVHILS